MVTGRGRTGSKYATAEGARRLRAELDELWLNERPAVTRAVAEAAAMGDRSENAEYIYGKRRLREIDRRVRYLRLRLDGLKVVDGPPADRGRAFFGAWVTIVDAEGRRRRHRIVGPDERFHGLMPDLLEGTSVRRLQSAAIRALTPKPIPEIDLYHVAPVKITVAEVVAEMVRELPTIGRTTFRSLTEGMGGEYIFLMARGQA